MNEYRLKKTQVKELTKKQLKEIEKRQKLALLYRTREKIEDFHDDILGIIENDGIKNDEQKTRLEIAFKTLPYILPQKRAIETTIITKTIEDIIREDIPEAEIIDTPENKPKNDNDNVNN